MKLIHRSVSLIVLKPYRAQVKNAEKAGHGDTAEFERLLVISSYYATRSACLGQEALAEHATKISVALLRYTEQIPADKAFYEAGLACKVSPHALICSANSVAVHLWNWTANAERQ